MLFKTLCIVYIYNLYDYFVIVGCDFAVFISKHDITKETIRLIKIKENIYF
jgi:hypothetical protein